MSFELRMLNRSRAGIIGYKGTTFFAYLQGKWQKVYKEFYFCKIDGVKTKILVALLGDNTLRSSHSLTKLVGALNMWAR